MDRQILKTVYFITGASGVGKTTLLAELKKRYKHKPWQFLHFDSVGVPSLEEMSRTFGSPTGWQEAKTFEWIDKILHEYPNERIYFEGQVNLELIRRAFATHHFDNYKIILLDCNEEEMGKRLSHNRQQPELFTPQMRNWLRFLRNQAEEFGALRLDTSKLSMEEILTILEDYTQM